jgi:hypothetical protein
VQLIVTLDPQTGQVQLHVNGPPDKLLMLGLLELAKAAVLTAPAAQPPGVQPADAAGVDAILRRLGRPPVSG